MMCQAWAGKGSLICLPSPQQAREAIFLMEAEPFAIPADERTAYLRARRTRAREWMRAADLDSPAPRGHYLREFGQSDRDIEKHFRCQRG